MLPDIDPTTMAIFIDWLYNQEFPYSRTSDSDTLELWKKRYNLSKVPDWLDFARIWVLADRFLVHELQTYHDEDSWLVWNSRPTLEAIEYAYNNLPEHHVFLDIMVARYTTNRPDDPMDALDIKQMEQFPKKFLCQVINILAEDGLKLLEDYHALKAPSSESEE